MSSALDGSSPADASSTGHNTRVSQRASRSCTECKRRKIRCDKTVPCSQCIRAKAPAKCRIEMVELTTKYTKSRQEIEFLHRLKTALTATSLAEANDLISSRLTLLETGQEPVKSRKPVPRGSSDHFHDVLNDQQTDETFDIAKTLMRLGRGYPNPADVLDQTVPDSEFSLAVIESAPDIGIARKLVIYYLKQLSWHHPVLHHGEFLIQCESFWTTGEMITPQWACVYFAVLSASAYNLPESLCDATYTRQILRQRSEFWYQQMFNTLICTDYTLNHSMFSIQGIIISCMVAHPLGQAVRQMVLLSSSLRIAQCLGYAAQTPSRPIGSGESFDLSAKITEEVQRRIWWQILVQDYFLVPMAGSYVALLMPQLIDGLRSPTTTTREAQYRHIKFIDSKMRTLMAELPAFLRPETPFDQSWPIWIAWARSTLTISAADKNWLNRANNEQIIMIHRSFLIKSFQDPQTYDFTRRTCVSAALTILNEFHRVKNNDVVRLWIIPTFTVSAAIVIGLDISYRMKNKEAYEAKHLELLNTTIEALRMTLMDYDVTVRQGVTLLENLLTHKLNSDMSPSLWDENCTPHLDELIGYMGENQPWDTEPQL
ncbi:hypothetical protein Cpir12675_003993 [Ceratocystis pirilliformis]|uniref:Zn(2)-C6 fungal-type domain-containing protein n=1 Tax=Ceratocystis pirilliformis TaxID=259994 RepID=A0ABR3YZ89_9PEZI